MGDVVQGPFVRRVKPQPRGPEAPTKVTPVETRRAVWFMRRSPKIKNIEELARHIQNYVWRHEITDNGGTFIISLPEKRHYLLSGITHKLYPLDINDKDTRGYFYHRYGLIHTETITKHLLASLEAYCNIFGKKREIRRFCYFDKRTETLYISRYDGQCWKLDGSQVGVVNNGEGGAIFIDDDDGIGVEDPTIGAHGQLIPRLVEGVQYVESTQGGLSPAQQRLALSIWIFALAFPDLMPAKPLLLAEGGMGSGKTTMIQLIQQALHGDRSTQTLGKNDEKDFGVHILRSPICLIDNADSFVDWLQDTLATYVTGGKWTRRALYTDDAQIKIQPQAYIAITTRNPLSFKRDDVADRCIILRMERRTEFTATSALVNVIERDRPALFGEWLWYLNRVVANIREGKLRKIAVGHHRMADFAALAHIIGDALGAKPITVSTMLDALQSEREVLISEGDTTNDLLDVWLETTTNIGKAVTVGDLFKDLSELAKQNNRSFYKSPNTLTQKLRSVTLAKYYDVKVTGMKGNAKLYEIRRRGKGA